MIRKGSLVKFHGKSRVIPDGKYLEVHDVKGDDVIVWWRSNERWTKRIVKHSDVEEVVE